MKSSLKPWKTIDSKMVFDHPWYQLRQDKVQLPNGKIIDDYFVSVRMGIVFIFPITQDREVILVRQYKHGIQEIITEMPAGVFNPEEESPAAAASRELKEETGYTTDRMIHLSTLFDDPSKHTSKVHIFLAENVSQTSNQELDETEEIEVLKIPLDQLQSLIAEGIIHDTCSIATSFLALSHLNKSAV